MNSICFIFARGGSKGIPGKNLRMFAGKPLIGIAVEHALSLSGDRRVLVSTDSIEIAKVAEQHGAEIPFLRPKELATDKSSEWEAWKHALNFLANKEGNLPESMISVPTTAPLRKINDIENCISEFENKKPDVVISITKSSKNPYFNMVSRSENGTVNLVNKLTVPITNRQEAPEIFDITTVCYVANCNYVLKSPNIYHGKIIGVEIPIMRSIDIDTEIDFEFAEFLYHKEKNLL